MIQLGPRSVSVRLILVATLIALCGSFAWAGVEFEGEGRAKVAGGNFISARKRAVVRAERDALRRALASLASPTELAAKDEAIRRAIYSRHGLFVRNYRVLAEDQGKSTLDLRLAVKIRMRKLSATLRKTLGIGRATKAGKTGKGEILISGELAGGGDGKIAEELTSLVCQVFRVQGFSCQDYQGGAADLNRWARSRGALAILRVRGRFSAAEGVRGLDLRGAKLELSLNLRRVKGDSEILKKDYVGWGASATRQDAEGRALIDALGAFGTDVSEAFTSHLAGQPTARDARQLQVSGVDTHSTYRKLLRELGRPALGLRDLELRRIVGGQLWLDARSDLSAGDLAGSLTAASFSSFRLKLEGRKGNVLQFRLQKLEPTTIPAGTVTPTATP